MKVLVTSARMPFALAVMRRLCEAGHEVFSSDTYAAAPGNHSSYVTAHTVTASPRAETERFVEQVSGFCSDHGVDVIVPAWEEAFYLATWRERLDEVAALYTPRFETLARMHDKHSFEELVEQLGIRAPVGVTVRSDEELREAVGRWPHYFGRGVYSRGGVTLLTNTGPLAGRVRLEDIHPTPDAPWLVQEFVEGPMVCTYSMLHGGRVTGHCAYRRRASTTTARPCSSSRLTERRRWRWWSASAPSSTTPGRCRSTSWTRTTGSGSSSAIRGPPTGRCLRTAPSWREACSTRITSS